MRKLLFVAGSACSAISLGIAAYYGVKVGITADFPFIPKFAMAVLGCTGCGLLVWGLGHPLSDL